MVNGSFFTIYKKTQVDLNKFLNLLAILVLCTLRFFADRCGVVVLSFYLKIVLFGFSN